MHVFRKCGMYLSLFIMWLAHVGRYYLFFFAKTESVRDVRVILVQDRRVVLVSHWYAPWVWTLPGGGVKRGETPEAAAVRETQEETGFEIKSLGGEIGLYRGSLGAGDTVAVYYAGDFGGSLALRPNVEIRARSWFDMDNLPKEISPENRRRIDGYRAGVRGERGKR